LAAPIVHLFQARGDGLSVKDYQNAILVNVAGLRFYDETQANFRRTLQFKSTLHSSHYLTLANIKYESSNFINAALAGTAIQSRAGHLAILALTGEGESWTVTLLMWILRKDISSGNPFRNWLGKCEQVSAKPMPPESLEKHRWPTTLLWMQQDADFGKPRQNSRYQTRRFHAAWAKP